MRKLILILLAGFLIASFITQSAIARDEKLKITTVTASSTYYNSPSYSPDKAIDGNEYTYWIGGMNMAPWWIAFDIGKIEKVDRIVIKWYNYYYYIPQSYDIQISSDGVSWTNLFTGIQGVGGTTGDIREIKQEARYIRLYINSVVYYYPILSEFIAYKTMTIPSVLRFKGRLGDSAEEPLTGSFKLTFRLYDKETGGVPLWTEVENSVSIESGLLNVELGNISPITLPFDRQYWFGVEVESNGEMLPRFRLTSVPYSFISQQ